MEMRWLAGLQKAHDVLTNLLILMVKFALSKYETKFWYAMLFPNCCSKYSTNVVFIGPFEWGI